jgi:hypothetical protein
MRDAAQLLWIANLGCIDLNPHPVRADDLDHPDELRIDLDPGPGVAWDDVRRVAMACATCSSEHGLRGWPKTSGSRGMHVNVRIERRWSFDEVRRAALALAREVERRAPELATSKWWKEERHGVFLDYNQNAKDRTVASAWSVRPTRTRACRCRSMERGRRVRSGGVHAGDRPVALRRARRRRGRHRRGRGIAGSAARALGAARAAGLGDAPWPPHYKKQAGEAPRVAPSRARAPHDHDGPRREEHRAPSVQASLITVAKARAQAEALAGLERWKARHPRRRRCWQIDDVLVDAMRGRLEHMDSHPRQSAARSRGAGPPRNTRSRLRSLAGFRPPRAREARRTIIAATEDTLELVGRRHLELIVAALRRRLVGTPAHELRGVPEAVPCMWS